MLREQIAAVPTRPTARSKGGPVPTVAAGNALSLIPPVGSNAATEVGPSPAACFDIAGVSAVGEEGEVRIYIAVAVMA